MNANQRRSKINVHKLLSTWLFVPLGCGYAALRAAVTAARYRHGEVALRQVVLDVGKARPRRLTVRAGTGNVAAQLQFEAGRAVARFDAEAHVRPGQPLTIEFAL